MTLEEFKEKYKHTIETEVELKDGRVLYTTHNNFHYWLKDKKGKVCEVAESYYRKALKHRI